MNGLSLFLKKSSVFLSTSGKDFQLDVRQEKAEKTFKSQTFTKTPIL